MVLNKKFTSVAAAALATVILAGPVVANASTTSAATETPKNAYVTDSKGVQHAVPTDGTLVNIDGLSYQFVNGQIVAGYAAGVDPFKNTDGKDSSNSAATSSSTSKAESNSAPTTNTSSTPTADVSSSAASTPNSTVKDESSSVSKTSASSTSTADVSSSAASTSSSTANTKGAESSTSKTSASSTSTADMSSTPTTDASSTSTAKESSTVKAETSSTAKESSSVKADESSKPTAKESSSAVSSSSKDTDYKQIDYPSAPNSIDKPTVTKNAQGQIRINGSQVLPMTSQADVDYIINNATSTQDALHKIGLVGGLQPGDSHYFVPGVKITPWTIKLLQYSNFDTDTMGLTKNNGAVIINADNPNSVMIHNASTEEDYVNDKGDQPNKGKHTSKPGNDTVTPVVPSNSQNQGNDKGKQTNNKNSNNTTPVTPVVPGQDTVTPVIPSNSQNQGNDKGKQTNKKKSNSTTPVTPVVPGQDTVTPIVSGNGQSQDNKPSNKGENPVSNKQTPSFPEGPVTLGQQNLNPSETPKALTTNKSGNLGQQTQDTKTPKLNASGFANPTTSATTLPQTGESQTTNIVFSLIGGLLSAMSALIFRFGYLRKYKHFNK